jgi:predicted DNA-binding protein (UPF0251 family)
MPCAVYFKPAGIPVHALEEVILTLDELESLRLADLDGLYQEQAAEKMKISRPTFSRIIEQARRKVADALIHGKALRIETGTPSLPSAARQVKPVSIRRPSARRCGGRAHGK